jgi:cell division protein FtsQ
MRRRIPLDAGAEQRYWRSRQNRRVRKVRRARELTRVGLIVACNAVLVAAFVHAAVGTVRGLGTSSEFAVARVEVAGCERVPPSRIESALAPWVGRNVLALDLAAIESQAEQDPWVLDAVARRVLPGTLYVTVQERTPAALALVGGQVLLIDATGHPIGPIGEGLAESLPVLTGLPARDDRRLAALLRRGVDALGDIERASPALGRAASELDLSAPDRIALRTVEGGPWILLDPERVDRNLSAFLGLRGEIDRLVGPASHIDLRWQDRLTLTPATLPLTGEDG